MKENTTETEKDEEIIEAQEEEKIVEPEPESVPEETQRQSGRVRKKPSPYKDFVLYRVVKDF
jgi:hypothetical protein